MAFPQKTAINREIILAPQQKAPYLGVLVPELQYRDMQADIAEMAIVQKQLEACEDRESQCDSLASGTGDFLVGAIMGVLLGGLLGVSFRK